MSKSCFDVGRIILNFDEPVSWGDTNDILSLYTDPNHTEDQIINVTPIDPSGSDSMTLEVSKTAVESDSQYYLVIKPNGIQDEKGNSYTEPLPYSFETGDIYPPLLNSYSGTDPYVPSDDKEEMLSDLALQED